MDRKNLRRFWLAVLMFTGIQTGLSRGLNAAGPKNEIKIDPRMKTEVIREINALLIEKYIFLDVAKQMVEHLNTRLARGDYDKIDDPNMFADVLMEDLLKISRDNHFYLGFDPERVKLIKAQQSESEDEMARANQALLENDRMINFGFKKLEHLKGNVGYLDLRFFCNAEYAGETAVAAMNFLASSNAVIIDLRNTPGGFPNMVQLLCSYFIKGAREGRTHLNTFERRYDNSIEQFWTISYLPGRRMYGTDLYVLTNQGTASGAEEFAYNMKNLKRATLVGEKTRGAANPVEEVVIQDRFVMHLPSGRPVNPISKTNWEQVGIEPDVAVPSDQAYDRAYLMALEKILKGTKDEYRMFQIKWAIDELNAKLDPVAVDTGILRRYAGEYGARKITFESGGLFYQRTGPKYRLVPIKENSFKVEGLENFRIEIVVDKKGDATELVAIYYDNGMRDINKRTK